MLALTLVVASIAVADSINPSTVVPALYLAGRHGAGGVASFTAGVFTVYLSGGLVLVLGPGPALIAAVRHAGPRVEHAVEASAGVLLLGAAVALWVSRRTLGRDEARPRARSSRTALALGAGIAAIELPTAFMYFGAVSAILESRATLPARVSLIVAYNALFVLPLVAILGVRLLVPDGAEARLRTAGDWLRRFGPIALTSVVGAVGVALVSVGIGGIVSA